MWQEGLHQYCFKKPLSQTAVMDKTGFVLPYIFEINITSHHTNTNTHTHIHTHMHTHTRSLAQEQANTNVSILIPLALVMLSNFPKRFMDSLIMQQGKTEKPTNITQHIQRILDKRIAGISIIPSMLVLNKSY